MALESWGELCFGVVELGLLACLVVVVVKMEAVLFLASNDVE